MYKAGDLEININKGPCKLDEGYCENYEHNHSLDARNYDEKRYFGNEVYLPHSCDSWVIGGVKEVELLIGDLLAALDKLNAAAV